MRLKVNEEAVLKILREAEVPLTYKRIAELGKMSVSGVTAEVRKLRIADKIRYISITNGACYIFLKEKPFGGKAYIQDSEENLTETESSAPENMITITTFIRDFHEDRRTY